MHIWIVIREDGSSEIVRMTLLQNCRKRAAKEELPLRRIFDDECRQSSDQASVIVFAEIENSMYISVVRRTAPPSLSTTPGNCDTATSADRFSLLGASSFIYRGEVSACHSHIRERERENFISHRTITTTII